MRLTKLAAATLAALGACSIPLSQAFYLSEDSDIEVFVELKNETAFFVKDGQTTGSANGMLDRKGSETGDLMKFENSARIFFNGPLGEESSWHAELRPVYDTEGVSGYRSHDSYTQNDWFRELYVDTVVQNWDVRIGKQQVVWGTADGIKLLDIINPTDFREMSQNAMEDSRIPIWMFKAERNVGDSSNVQLIVSQHEENKIPGLNSNGDQGHPFIMKGVDSITGEVNGFRNIAPALSNVAATFSAGAMLGGFAATGAPPAAGLTPFTGLTVEGFARNQVDRTSAPGAFLFPGMAGFNPANAENGFEILNDLAQNGFQPGDPNGNNNRTNLMPVNGPAFTDVTWNSGTPSSAFEYMSNATFATFNSFSRCIDGDGGGCNNLYHPLANPGGTDFLSGGVATEYRRDYPDAAEPNAGFRFKSATDGGLNYSFNYFYHYGANPEVNLSWHDSVTGDELNVIRAAQINPAGGDFRANPDPTASLGVNDVPNNVIVDQNPLSPTFGQAMNSTTIMLFNPNPAFGANPYYGPVDPSTGGLNANPNGATLRFTESLYRVHSIGASFDYAIDTELSPIVIRGEFLYDKDEKQPVIDKRLLAIGDLSNALVMEEADMFKYVLGADINLFTNLLVSGQFIQFRNLDYIHNKRGNCTTQFGVPYDCDRYTADFSTLHLSNGMQRGWRNKEFYSLFLSKPFGASQLGRVNNIFIYEEGGGMWNRFDVEYSFTDELIGSAELNMYFGDNNTTFGQFEDSSNVQFGLKYIIQ